MSLCIPAFLKRAGDMRARASPESERPLHEGHEGHGACELAHDLEHSATSALCQGTNTIAGKKNPSALPGDGLGRGSRAGADRAAIQCRASRCVRGTPSSILGVAVSRAMRKIAGKAILRDCGERGGG